MSVARYVHLYRYVWVCTYILDIHTCICTYDVCMHVSLGAHATLFCNNTNKCK